MLDADRLACVRGDRPLFQEVSFSLEAGAALQVTGVNGSGKTSLLRILCGLSAPAAGEVRWQGSSTRVLREEFFGQLVYLGHAPAVKDELTPVENLMTAVMLGGIELDEGDAREALERIGLAGREDLPTKVLSQGQRRRVALARLLMCEKVPLWVLDEPFTALDRPAVEQLCGTIESHLQRGGLLVFTTHQEAPIRARELRRIELGRS